MLMVTVWPGSVRLCPRCRSKRLATQRRCCAQCKGARRERCWGCLAPNAVPGGVGKVCTLHTQIHLTLHKREYPQYTLDSNQPPSAATAPCHALMYKTDGTVKWPKPSAHGRASLCLGMYDVHACTCDDECVHRQEPSPATTHQDGPPTVDVSALPPAGLSSQVCRTSVTASPPHGTGRPRQHGRGTPPSPHEHQRPPHAHVPRVCGTQRATDMCGQASYPLGRSATPGGVASRLGCATRYSCCTIRQIGSMLPTTSKLARRRAHSTTSHASITHTTGND